MSDGRFDRGPRVVARRVASLGVILLLAGSLSGGGDVTAGEYLSAGDAVAVTAGGGVVMGFGYWVGRSSGKRDPVIRGHLPGEEAIQRWLGGECRTGERNFLDNDFGSLVTPVLSAAVLTGLDLGYPRADAERDAGQDLLLWGAGLGVTKGVTDLLKGVFARRRPFHCILGTETESAYDAAYIHHSFPSGHTSGAFFAAAFVNLRARETMRREWSADRYRSWRWVSPTIAYGWASVVGLSRVHAYKHHLSDVIVGAVLGIAVAEGMYQVGESAGDDGGGGAAPLVKLTFRF